MSVSVYNKLINNLIQEGKGRIVFPADFQDLGSSGSVKNALSELTQQDILIRLGQGVYLFPERDPELGIIYPSLEKIAEEIARRDKARIIPTGAYALNRLGLSTQVPMKIVYLTDGAPRTINIGKQKITFRRSSPKKLAARSKIALLVIQALQEIGQQQVDASVIQKIEMLLDKESADLIRHDAKLAPAWITALLFNLLNKREND